MTSPADWALAYVERGWSVIPLRPRDKRPLVAWTRFQREHPSPEQLEAWFRRSPDANIGIVTGNISGLLVLDIDAGHGGNDSLDALERQFGPLPAGPTVATGGSGRHRYFAHPGRQVPNRAAIMAGLDLRGDGGYVVAPPSIHPSGVPYRWLAGHAPEQMPVPVMPEWLRRRCGIGLHRPSNPPDHWRRLAYAGVEQGARNNTIASFTGHLLWHGVDPDVVLQLMLGWNRWRCQPPLDDAEVTQIVESIVRLHHERAPQ